MHQWLEKGAILVLYGTDYNHAKAKFFRSEKCRLLWGTNVYISLISYYYLHCRIFPFLTHCDYCTDSFDHLDSELQYRLESKRFQKDLEKSWPKLGYRKKEKNLLDFAGTTL